MRRLTTCLIMVLVLGIIAVPGNAQDEEAVGHTGPLRVAVTMQDIEPIVRSLGGSMVEIVVFPLDESTSASHSEVIRGFDLVIIVNSEPLEIEGEMAESLADIEYLNWEDFARHGAVLKDFPGYEACPYGWWMGFDNIEAIASAIADRLMTMGLNTETVTSNLMRFLDDVVALRVSGKDMVVAVGRERSQWVAMSPEAAYIIDNLGLAVGTVAWHPDTGVATGHDMVDIENKLQSREYAGMVCNISGRSVGMGGSISSRDAEIGQLTLQLEESTGTQIAWVKCSADESENPLIENATYNAAAIAAAAAVGDVRTSSGATPVSAHLIWALIVFVLLILLVMQNKQVHYSGALFAPAAKSGKKKKK